MADFDLVPRGMVYVINYLEAEESAKTIAWQLSALYIASQDSKILFCFVYSSLNKLQNSHNYQSLISLSLYYFNL